MSTFREIDKLLVKYNTDWKKRIDINEDRYIIECL